MTDPAFLILTVIGDDRPGLVGELAATISDHDGNWLESSMANLAGKFAGIVKVAVPAGRGDALKSALGRIGGLTVMAASAGSAAAAGSRRFRLSLIGHDRLGIVREVSQILARHGVNVEELNTHVASAPMSAEMLFHADASLSAPASLDRGRLTADLERISNDLMVDISVAETIS